MLQPKGSQSRQHFCLGRSRTVADPCRGTRAYCLLRDKVPPLGMAPTACETSSLTLVPLLSYNCATLSHPKRRQKLLDWKLSLVTACLVSNQVTTGKLLPRFPNSLFTHLTWQKRHKPGKQKNRFPGHLMGAQTSSRCLHSPSSPPAFPSPPPGLPLLHPLVEPNSLGQRWSPMLCLHSDRLLSPLHTCFHSDTQGGSFGFYIHDIPILYFISSAIQTGDQKGTTTQAASSITRSIMLL